MSPPPTKGQESKDYDETSSHRLSALTIRLHGRNLFQNITKGYYHQKLNFCIQNGRFQPQLLLDTHHFHYEATLDKTDVDYLKSFVNTLYECREMLVHSLAS